MKSFLPFNATFMLDFVVVSLFLVFPILFYGIYLAKKRQYLKHAKVMSFLVILVFVVVFAFETSMRLEGGIENIMIKANRESAYHDYFKLILYIHLFFSISTCFLWLYTIYAAIKKFGFKNPMPGVYSKTHKILAALCILDMLCVAFTGLYVYCLAFIHPI